MMGITWIFSLLFVFVIQMYIVKNMKYNYGGSDHFFHYRIIKAIKDSHHNFLISHCQPAYPKLYHFICSFFNDEFLLKKANYINYAFVFLISCVFFIFMYFNFTLEIMQINGTDILLIALLFATIPITYVVWNAKFSGLSARAFGLFLNYCHSMVLFFYLLYGDFYLLVIMLFFIFLQIIGSQFAFQFTVFSSVFISIVACHYEILFLIPLSVILIFILDYKYAKRFFYGQYNHKRNYAKFMIYGYQFKQRYSIWRDFIYDFWVKKDKNYILKNPIWEVIIGAFPNCCILICYWFIVDTSSSIMWILYLLLSSSFFAFFLTSLRIGRFLGEPQRYIEFGTPFACILCVLLFPIWFVVCLITLNIIVIKWYINNSQCYRENPEFVKVREELLKYANENFNENYIHMISNDGQLLKYFFSTEYQPHFPHYSIYYKNQEEFSLNFYQNDYNRLSPYFVAKEMNECRRGILVLYANIPKFYNEDKIIPLLDKLILTHLVDIGKFKVFRFEEERSCL